MPLMRTKEITLWDNEAKDAWASTDLVDTSKVGSIGVWIWVTAATTIAIRTITGTYIDNYDTITLPADGKIFVNIWSWPFANIKFMTEEATTITINLVLKT